MLFLRQAKIPGHLEDHIMAKTNGSRNFSDFLEAMQVLARRPMTQASSSYPSFHDDSTDSTYVAEYYDMDDHYDAEDGGYEDKYNEFEDYDGEWIRRSQNRSWPAFWKISRKAKRGLGRISGKARRVLAKGEFPDKEGGKGNRPENDKQVQLKLQGVRLNRGWRHQATRATSKGRSRPHFAQVDDLLTLTRCFKCGEVGHLARNCSQKKEDDLSLFQRRQMCSHRIRDLFQWYGVC